MPTTIDRRSNAQRHRDARVHVLDALGCLRRAEKDEGELEWSGVLNESIETLVHLAERLKWYADHPG